MEITNKYKGLYGAYKYHEDDNVYHGKIDNVIDLITFKSENKENIQKEFENAVDDYLFTLRQFEMKIKIIFVSTSINGDILGVSNSYEKAVKILDEKYHGEINHNEFIDAYELNRFYYG